MTPLCCSAYGSYWHKAADLECPLSGRYRRESGHRRTIRKTLPANSLSMWGCELIASVAGFHRSKVTFDARMCFSRPPLAGWPR
jgi:hypothetical protein